MKLTVFQSDQGDCLLLTAEDGTTILVDGGMRDSYTEHVAKNLAKVDKLDLICVSHIDRDHISGVLQLLDDMVAWKVYEYQRDGGNTGFKKPVSPKPPDVHAIWHNAFGELVEDNDDALGSQLVQNMQLTNVRTLLSGDKAEALAEVAEQYVNLVSSMREGLEVSRRVGPRQLGIPLNEPTGGKLIFVDTAPSVIPLGTMDVTVIGPFRRDLEALRKEWNQWLKKSRRVINRIRKEARRDEKNLDLALDDGQLLHSSLLALTDALGDRSNVTVPNLASLMMLVEEGGKSVLLTGDGHSTDILKGLQHCGKLEAGRGFHVDVLKVQHHGSEHNLDANFCKHVTADHYVFCGNGAHHNPDLEVVRTVIDSRVGAGANDSLSSGVKRPFKLWFNSSAAVTEEGYRDHMRRLEQLMVAEAAKFTRLHYRFLRRGSIFEISV